MMDPRTRKAVTPDTMLTLDDGRQITAAKYYEQMNKLEEGLNRLGYSFRDRQMEVVTDEVVVDERRTLAQIRRLPFATPEPGTAARLDAIAQAHRDYIRAINPSFGKPARRAYSARVSSGLYQQNVGALVFQPGATRTLTGRRLSLRKTRPDFVPGDSLVTGLNSDVETLPGISSDPGWAMEGKRVSAIEINAFWSSIAFYINYKVIANAQRAPTAQLAPKYIWQVAKAGSNMDNFGSFAKTWDTEFDEQELLNWKNPPGLIASGDVNFAAHNPADEQKSRLFQIDFGQLVGEPPDGPPVLYVVRVVPVNADGSIAGYPSRPVLVSYGKHPELAPPKIRIYEAPAKIPVNNIDRQAQAYFGNPKVMSINFSTRLQSNGSPAHQSASIGFEAGGSVYGNSFSLVKVSVGGELTPFQYDVESGKESSPGQVEAKFSIMLGGFELPCDGCTESAPRRLELPFDKSQPFEAGYTYFFPVGPIDVSATIGVRGEVGVGGFARLSTVNSEGPFRISAGPHMSISAFLEPGVGLGFGAYDVVKVGVEGSVNLISAGFVVDFDIHPRNSPNGRYAGRVTELRTLDGNFNAFAKAGICPFCKKWTTRLYGWEGYDMLSTDPGRATLFAGGF
jgi:hypothetical protein